MKILKRFCIFSLIIGMLCLTGCWNYRELDDLSMVAGFAIDKGRNGYKYHLTFELLNMADNTFASNLLETDGDTIFDGVRNAVSKTQRQLFFSGYKIVIINKDIAAKGIAPLLDWVLSDSEPRLSINYLISKEDTAAEILKQKPVTDTLESIEIWNTISMDSIKLSKSPSVKLYEAVNMLEDQGIALILPTICVIKSGDKPVSELDGTAVFKKDKVVGYLNRDETKSLLFLKNGIRGGLLLMSYNSKEKNTSLEIFENKTTVTPLISNGKPTVQINFKTKLAISENDPSQDYSTSEGIKDYENHAAAELKDSTMDLIKKIQTEYKSDIFGFGNTFAKNNPDWWKNNKANWDKTFLTLKCTVSADAQIVDTSMAKTTIKVGD
jgi:spore germination protein KC